MADNAAKWVLFKIYNWKIGFFLSRGSVTDCEKKNVDMSTRSAHIKNLI